MKRSSDLLTMLDMIHKKSYAAYKSLQGSFVFQNYKLTIDHVQGDPFASPSKIHVSIQNTAAKFPKSLYDTPYRRIALQDYLTRLFFRRIEEYTFQAKGSGKSGLISTSRCGQQILERTACTINPDTGDILARLEIGFPANGRTINAPELAKILFDFLPKCIASVFFYESLNIKTLEQIAFLADDQHYIRKQIQAMGYVAFIANGSILQRETGVSDKPHKKAVPFTSPASMEITLCLPHKGNTKGMAIKKGITLIVGGGYHGKSTLLKALEMGVYNHIGNDGREYVITEDSALKIRAEDGRSIKNVDISMFINELPNKKNTVSFDTEDASGSTSQAANVIEGIEAGASLFLIDEDTSATNFMLRDALMQRVIHRDKEPITPFLERIELLYQTYQISTIIVAGSSGAFFEAADTIIQMDSYHPVDITEYAKTKARKYMEELSKQSYENHPSMPPAFTKVSFQRCPKPDSSIKDSDRQKIKILGKDVIQIDHETIDLRYVEQITDTEQLASLAYFLVYAQRSFMDGKHSMTEIVENLLTLKNKDGLASIVPLSYLPTGLAMPRKQEIFSCINRYRKLRC